MTASIDEAKRLLYGYPVESFVEERNALVKEIRSGGDRDLANEVKTLRKPSAVAAEVNQIVRADPAGVDLILQAAALLRSAQAGALEGTTINASELQQQYRAAIQALAQTATSRPVEVRAALEAATIDEASNDDLRVGCLVAVPTPVSIFGLTAATSARADAPGSEHDDQGVEPPVDELQQRRVQRAAERASKNERATKEADKARAARRKAEERDAEEREAAEQAAAETAAAEKAAAEKAAAEEARRRKEAEKARQKQLKIAQKQHREAVRAHLGALDAEETLSVAVEQAEQDLADADAEIETAEQALAQLKLRRSEVAGVLNDSEQARAEARIRSEEAQTAAEALADALAALEDADL